MNEWLSGTRLTVAATCVGRARRAFDLSLRLRGDAKTVRPADRKIPGRVLQARRHGDGDRRGRLADARRRLAARPGARGDARDLLGQALRQRDAGARHRRGDPDPWRHGADGRPAARALLARRAGRAHLGRHIGDPPPHHQPRPAAAARRADGSGASQRPASGPKSIAVFGGREAAQVGARRSRPDGVSRRDLAGASDARRDVHGRRCFRSVAELPGAPDAAFVGVNRAADHRDRRRARAARRRRRDLLRLRLPRGARTARRCRTALLEAAGDMPILGPNCYGLINYLDGALLWPDQHGGARVERGVAIVTQCSNIAINMTMQRRGLPIAYVATAGNQAQTGLSEIAAAALEDRRVTAVGLHVEGIDDVAALRGAWRSARASSASRSSRCTVGRSEQSRAATISHTASIAGSEAATAAFFARARRPAAALDPGVPRDAEAAACARAAAGRRPLLDELLGRRGVADGGRGGRTWRALPAARRRRARRASRRRSATWSTVANPLDYHTFVWAKEAAMTATFSAMIGCGFDLSMLVLDFPRDRPLHATPTGTSRVRAHSTAAARQTGGRTARGRDAAGEHAGGARGGASWRRASCRSAGIDEALAAAEAAAFIGARWKEPLPRAGCLPREGAGVCAASGRGPTERP